MDINDLSHDLQAALADLEQVRESLTQLGMTYERAREHERIMLRMALDANTHCLRLRDRLAFITGRLEAMIEVSRR